MLSIIMENWFTKMTASNLWDTIIPTPLTKRLMSD